MLFGLTCFISVGSFSLPNELSMIFCKTVFFHFFISLRFLVQNFRKTLDLIGFCSTSKAVTFLFLKSSLDFVNSLGGLNLIGSFLVDSVFVIAQNIQNSAIAVYEGICKQYVVHIVANLVKPVKIQRQSCKVWLAHYEWMQNLLGFTVRSVQRIMYNDRCNCKN